MYDFNEIYELVDENILTDAEKLLDFIVDNDMGEVFVEWCNSNN